MKKVVAMLLALMLAMTGVSALAYTQDELSDSRDVIFRVTTGYTWTLPDPSSFSVNASTLWTDELDMGKLEVKDLNLWPGQTLNFYVTSANDFQFKSADEACYFNYEFYVGKAEYDANGKLDAAKSDSFLRTVKEWGPQPVVVGSRILDKKGYLLLKAAPEDDETFWKSYKDYTEDDLEMYKITPDVYAGATKTFSEHLYIQPVEKDSKMTGVTKDTKLTDTLTIYCVVQDLPDDDQYVESTT